MLCGVVLPHLEVTSVHLFRNKRNPNSENISQSVKIETD